MYLLSCASFSLCLRLSVNAADGGVGGKKNEKLFISSHFQSVYKLAWASKSAILRITRQLHKTIWPDADARGQTVRNENREELA